MMESIGIGLPPVLRYARRQGLCYDHRQEDILQLLAGEHLIDRSPDLRELPDFVPPQFDPPSDGKLRVSQKASRLVVSTTTQLPKPDWRNLLSDHRRIRKLKIEPPLLITYHFKDMRKFLPKRSVGIEDIDFPLEMIDTEKGEGLSWPSHMSTLRSQWDHEITHHKLQTSRETLQFLSRTLRDTWTEEDKRKLVRECCEVEKKPRPEPLSPPLMPEDEPLMPYLPSSPSMLLPLTSDPVSLTSIPIDSPPRGRLYKDHIPLENRVIPDVELPEYHPRYVKFEDDELIDYEIDERTSSTVTDEKTGVVSSDLIEPRPENDFVCTGSFLVQLTVPALSLYTSNETYSIPPLLLPDQSAPLFEDERAHRRMDTIRPLQSKPEVSATRSVPFSEKLDIAIPDVIHGIAIPARKCLFSETIEGPKYELPVIEDVVKSHHMLWKPEILSLLKMDDEYDEELMLDFPEDETETLPEKELDIKPNDICGLPTFVTREHILTEVNIPDEETPNMELADELQINYQEKNKIVLEKRKPLEELINEAKKMRIDLQKSSITRFSATVSLSSFLSTRSQNTDLTQKFSDPRADTNTQDQILVPGTQDADKTTTKSTPPPIPALDRARTIFFSNTYLQQHRSLLRFFESWASGNLKIIYRDLEVPILLNPRHALILTSLQALMQRPLPGQGGRTMSAVHHQISRLGRESSLDVLTVLVSIPFSSSSNQTLMPEFTAYCEDVSRASNCDIRPWHLPAGEVELHSMVTQLIIKYAFRSSDLVFPDIETKGEGFLAKVGINPFAAQVVLDELKDKGDGRPWGLNAFMRMSKQEREDRFVSLVGKKMLKNVSKKMHPGNF